MGEKKKELEVAKLWQNLDLVNLIYLFAPFFTNCLCQSQAEKAI